MRVQEYEDEDDDDEPSLWTRVRSLLLNLSLQIYHRLMRVREQLQRAIRMLGDTADMVRTNPSEGQDNVRSAVRANRRSNISNTSTTPTSSLFMFRAVGFRSKLHFNMNKMNVVE